jgi:hypothetical protein
MSTTPIAFSPIVDINNNDEHDRDAENDADSSMMDEDEDHACIFDLEDVIDCDDQKEVEEEDELEEDDDIGDGGSDSEENENIPTLTLKLSRPVSSRFDEMLYWVS